MRTFRHSSCRIAGSNCLRESDHENNIPEGLTGERPLQSSVEGRAERQSSTNGFQVSHNQPRDDPSGCGLRKRGCHPGDESVDEAVEQSLGLSGESQKRQGTGKPMVDNIESPCRTRGNGHGWLRAPQPPLARYSRQIRLAVDYVCR